VNERSAAAAARATVYGYPRQGPDRELKKAIEGYWKGRVTADALQETTAQLRRNAWRELAEAGIHEVPTGDFSLYDHVLDATVMLGAIPARHREAVAANPLDGYFAMARGTQQVAPLEMTKWFDTNYHYLVPELGPDTVFTANPAKQVAELREALAQGHDARPVLVGPITYLLLAKPAPGVAADFQPITLLDRLLPVYAEILAALREAGAEWVQLDEPALVQDRTPADLNATARAYRDLGSFGLGKRPKLLVASYFDRLGEALPVLAKAPIEGLALDFTGPAAANLDDLAAVGGLPGKRLVAGVVDGRNIWINNLAASLTTLATLLGLADRVDVAASCSLLHVPVDAAAERDLDPQIARWLAFARQKTTELSILTRGLAQGTDAIAADLAANRADLASRAGSPITRDPAVRARTAAVTDADAHRAQAYPERAVAQRARLGLPLLPTTTIGSFPQTTELRTARADLRAGRIDTAAYEETIASEIREVLAFQEKAGIDVLVHGEPERNDMVQYFAEQLTATSPPSTAGSSPTAPATSGRRSCRRRLPPRPMTVRWASYAQAQTDRRSRACSPARSPCSPGPSSATTSRSPRPPARSPWPCATRSPTSRRPGSGADPGRRAGPARDPPAARGRPRAVPGVGHRGVPAQHQRRARGHPDPHAHVLRRVRRDPHRDRRPRRGRDKPRGRPLAHGSRPVTCRGRLPARGRPGRLRHPLPARARRRRDHRPAPRGTRGSARRTAVGQPRLRPEDPRLDRSPQLAGAPGRSGPRGARQPARRNLLIPGS
jgi:5-methyltetrahydropteroyltriglutamate--homocysteine methyltransferase